MLRSWINYATEKDLPVYFLIVAAFIFNVLTLQGDHQWNGDYALYVAHAKNIAEGIPYAQTGYVYNPYSPWTSPVAYPPVYPLFLAPVYQAFGMDIYAMKVAGLCTVALFLLVLHRYVRNRLASRLAQVAVVAAVAFSPWIWLFKDQVLPDFLYMFFTYVALLFIDTRANENKSVLKTVLCGLVMGVLAYLAYGTRSLGLLLMPALVLSDLIRHRTISRLSIVCVLVFAGLYLLQNTYLHTDKSYFNSYVDSLPLLKSTKNKNTMNTAEIEPVKSGFSLVSVMDEMQGRVFSNLDYYHNIMSSYWGSGKYLTVEKSVYAITGLLAIVGFVGLVVRKPSTGDYFIVLYVIVLLVVPFRQNRYLLPLIPLYFIYIFHGIEWMNAGLKRVGSTNLLRGVIQAGVVLAVIFSYTVKYAPLDFGARLNGVEKKQSVEMFEFVREQTPADSLLVFRKPRILALLGERRSILYHSPENPDDLWQFFERVGATHIVSQKRSAGIQPGDNYLAQWVVGHRDRLTPIFENDDFYIYRIEAS